MSARNSLLLQRPPETGFQVADGIQAVMVVGRLDLV
jgi:hypothetical protein